MNQTSRDLLAALHHLLDESTLLVGDRIPGAAIGDASQSGAEMPWLYVRPTTVDQISDILRACNEFRWPVTIQGGRTGLAGGANPEKPDVVISMERFSGVEELDRDAGIMVVKAGTILEVAQKAAEEAGFMLPIDLGSRGSCQIGGNIATNAGGLRVIRHGMTRDNILGLEVVLADGSVVPSMNRFAKNNTGYDLRQLFIGSEGTLGVITRAVLKLKPLPAGKATALVALANFPKVIDLLSRAQASLAGLSAFEVMWSSYFDYSAGNEGLGLFDRSHPFTVIIEQSGSDETEALESFLGPLLEDGVIEDALIAQSDKEARQFWQVREGLSYDRRPDLVNLDVSIAIGRMEAFAEACTAALAARFPGAHVSFFGHMGDSNLHIAVLPGSNEPSVKHAVDEIAYGVVRTFQGSISAEHGIGLLKRDYLGYSRSPAELALMRTIKHALDPNGILNPGKVLAPL